ncbi:MAG: hypothetical protein E6J10_10475 [Chloroflexi bacterium]|nr:MAG: hypothetical protein E6J10_10475 [Chloroflexota bacterium]
MSLEGPRIKQRAPLLIGLAVLVVAAGSIGLFYLVASRQKSTAQTNATATVQTKTRATITSQQNPYTHKGTLVLNDILNGASNSDNWELGTNTNGAGCIFRAGAYHVTQPMEGFFHGCIAQATNFSNFVYQVQMTIAQIGSGGILFRTHLAMSKTYYFSVSADGSYALRVYVDPFIEHASKLTPNNSTAPAIHTGLNQTNTIAVVANGPILDLYVNLQHIATFHNSALNSGQIGVFAENDGIPVEVVFSNAKVWTL